MLRLVLVTTVALALTLLSASRALAAAYLDIPGIPGNADEPDHEDWIKLILIDIDVSTVVDPTEPRGRDLAVFHGSLVTEIDRSYPKLLNAVAQGTVFNTVTIDLTASIGGARETYLQYKLEGVRVVSSDLLDFDTTLDQALRVEWTFSVPDRLETTYFLFDDDGRPEGSVVSNIRFDQTGAGLVSGDYDQSGVVDAADYYEWTAQYGDVAPAASDGSAASADGNRDGVVNAADYTVWRDQFTPVVATVEATPEPTTGALLAIGTAVGVLAHRRRS